MKFRFPVFSQIFFLVFSVSVFAQTNSTSQAAVEARLKAAEKPKPPGAASELIATLTHTRAFHTVAISPDGKKVAWVASLPDKTGAASEKSAIYVESVDGKPPVRRISAGAGAPSEEGSIAWSPDSKQIAFLSDAAKSGERQLYVKSANGGPAIKLTSVKGFLDAPRFSPDGKNIAVLFTENAVREAGPLVASAPEHGVIKDAFFEQRLAVIDVATHKLRQISPADTYVYEYSWAPDNKRFAVTAALGNGDNNWYIAELFTLDATNGIMKSIYKPALQIAQPAWSHDGSQIAFIEGLMSDEGSVGGDVFAISPDGGKPQNLTPEMKASASSLSWTNDGKITFGAFKEADSAIASLDPASRKITWLYEAAEHFTAGSEGPSVSLSSDGETSAVVRSSFSSAPEVWAGSLGKWQQITRDNASQKAPWGEARSIHWKSDAFDVQGWLIYPANFDPAKKYPLVVSVHGGPGAAVLSSWPGAGDYAMALLGAGYFVFKPNPRGSFGMGEAFTRANVKDFGYGDLRDILSGVDESIRIAPVDANHLGITGWSYGGYMTMWTVTQTNRFKAAVAGAGIANFQSYYGQNKIDQWMIPFFGKSVYDDPEVYAKSSPITFIKKVKTPTLILVGDSDAECPPPQSYEFWHALKALGVDTELVVYEHEGHAFSHPKHILDRVDRTISWFNARLH